jgi:hypothetical protein
MKVEFFSTIPGVAEFFPVLAAKDVLPRWTEECRADYLRSNKRDIHTFRCPGIFDLMSTGFIITAWHDINIEVTPDKLSITTPDEMLNKLSGKPTVGIQDTVAKFFPKRPWSQKHILKINTPWNVIVPKGLKFIHIPLPFTEFMDYESVMGIHDPSIASDVNIQGYVNKTVGNVFIKAGTPICQLVPLSEKTYTHVCRDMNESDEKWFKRKKYFDSCSFVAQRSRIKEAYNKFFGER